MTDLLSACREHLLDQAAIVTLVGSDPKYANWVFRNKLPTQVEGSGMVAIVLARRGEWAQPNQHNSMQFPRLRVECYADSTRDTQKRVTSEDAEDRAFDAQNLVADFLHDCGNVTHSWGTTETLRIVGCLKITEPFPTPVDETWKHTIKVVSDYGVVL